MTKQKTEIMNRADTASLGALAAEFPTETSFQRSFLPRFSMHAKDQTEGKGKDMKVVTTAGTFYTEKQSDEMDEEGNKPFVATEIGDEAEGIIIYKRKQLRLFDEVTESFISSPVYDTDDEIIPLFQNKKEIKRGTPAELKADYPGVTAKGKPKSNLEENVILYVLVNGELHQMSLRGSAMYNYKDYTKSVVPPTVLTSFGSEERTQGSNEWNATTFKVARPITQIEADTIIPMVAEIKEGIASEKQFYSARADMS